VLFLIVANVINQKQQQQSYDDYNINAFIASLVIIVVVALADRLPSVQH